MKSTWTIDKSGLNSLDKQPVASNLEVVLAARRPPPYLLEISASELPKSPLHTSSVNVDPLRTLELQWVRMRDLVVSHMLNSKLMLLQRKQ